MTPKRDCYQVRRVSLLATRVDWRLRNPRNRTGSRERKNRIRIRKLQRRNLLRSGEQSTSRRIRDYRTRIGDRRRQSRVRVRDVRRRSVSPSGIYIRRLRGVNVGTGVRYWQIRDSLRALWIWRTLRSGVRSPFRLAFPFPEMIVDRDGCGI